MTFEERVEEFRIAWRVFIIAFATSLGIDKFCYWLADKLRRKERD